jgi:hypothetical protein
MGLVLCVVSYLCSIFELKKLPIKVRVENIYPSTVFSIRQHINTSTGIKIWRTKLCIVQFGTLLQRKQRYRIQGGNFESGFGLVYFLPATRQQIDTT